MHEGDFGERPWVAEETVLYRVIDNVTTPWWKLKVVHDYLLGSCLTVRESYGVAVLSLSDRLNSFVVTLKGGSEHKGQGVVTVGGGVELTAFGDPRHVPPRLVQTHVSLR